MIHFLLGFTRLKNSIVLLFVFGLCINAQLPLQAQELWNSTISTNVNNFSSPRAVDLTGDGVLDIVTGGGLEGAERDEAFCAFNGATGEILWTHGATDQIYGSARFLDITDDGIPDVFMGGRLGEFRALDGATGELIWQFYDDLDVEPIEAGILQFYNPQFIDDISGDGIADILQSNGGDPTAHPDSTDRPPGSLMLINSVSGALIAEADMPDGGETYMSPIINDLDGDGELDIIFGTGGETIEGALFRTTLSAVLEEDISGSINLLQGSTKGFIGPPSLADFNMDEVNDIAIMSYGGEMIVIDGATNEIIWQVDFEGTESISSPTICHLNNDGVPDVYCSTAIGETPGFTGFIIFAIDGASGEVIFEQETDGWSLISAPAADIDGDGLDEILVCENTSFFAGPPFQHQIYWLDIDAGGETTQVADFTDGTNLGSSPLLQDLDGDGSLDLTYIHHATGASPKPGDGFTVRRIDLAMSAPETISWASYMGTNYDGVFENVFTNCLDFTPSIDIQNACSGESNGSVSGLIEGGTPNYVVNWNGIEFPPSSSSSFNFSGLAPDDYSVQVTDDSGCSQTFNFTISSSAAIEVSADITDVSFPETGSITLDVSGGTGDLSYAWSNGSSSQNLSGLESTGTYSVTITDENDCTYTDSFDVLSTGIDELSSSSLIVEQYPGHLNISANELLSAEAGQLYIWSIDGRMLYTHTLTAQQSLTVPTNNMNAGMYLIQFVQDGKALSRKVLLR